MARNSWCPALAGVPMLVFLNPLMLYVCLNDTALIAQAAGLTADRLAAFILPGAG
jgi:hypothetical protein